MSCCSDGGIAACPAAAAVATGGIFVVSFKESPYYGCRCSFLDCYLLQLSLLIFCCRNAEDVPHTLPYYHSRIDTPIMPPAVIAENDIKEIHRLKVSVSFGSTRFSYHWIQKASVSLCDLELGSKRFCIFQYKEGFRIFWYPKDFRVNKIQKGKVFVSFGIQKVFVSLAPKRVFVSFGSLCCPPKMSPHTSLFISYDGEAPE